METQIKERRRAKMMNKRVYGVLGVSSIMANWNADFTGHPKTTSSGKIFGSDKAFKYPIKKLWEQQGEKVLYIKSLEFEEKSGNLVPRTLKGRYEFLFKEVKLEECKDPREVIKHLFHAIDVKNFGATFAEAKNNISITGAVQFGQGMNYYEESESQEQQILSPFRDPKVEDAKNSTLGTKIVSDEAHYFYPFVVNPLAYKEFVELGVTEGYTEEDYQKFKEASLVAATAYATNAKEGCENEFGLFVETKLDCYLPNLTSMIRFEKGEHKNKISVLCGSLLNDRKGQIEKVELYYNPETTEIETDIDDITYYHIVTQKEV